MSRTRLAAAVAVLALGAAGCGGVPIGGKVHVGTSAPPPPQQQPVRVIAPKPYAGEPPKKVVQGFLDASASFDDNNAAARLFLVSAAASSWDPSDAGTVVYHSGASGDAASPVLTPTVSGASAAVKLTASRVARIGADGAYRVAHGDLKTTFNLRRTAEGWRIADPPKSLLLTNQDVLLSFQPLNVYFLNRAASLVVPDRVFVQAPPGGGGTATALVRRLLAGPSSALTGAVRTAFPGGTTLLGNVPVDRGLAQVDLSEEALSASEAERRALAAQLVYTLRQLSSVTRVRITAGGRSLLSRTKTLRVSDYDAYDPTDVPTKVRFVYTADGKLRTANGKPVAGPLGADDHGIRDVAISADGNHVSGLVKSGEGTGLLVGSVSGSHTVATVADKLTPPSYDRSDRAWTVATHGGNQHVYAVSPGGRVVDVDASQLTDRGTVSRLAISPAGARAVAVVGGRVLIGRVAGTAAHPALDGFVSIQPSDFSAAGDVAWLDTDRVDVLMRPQDQDEVVPVRITVDGSDPVEAPTTGLPAKPTQIAAAPGENELVVANGKIFSSAGSGWRAITTGSSPAYPG